MEGLKERVADDSALTRASVFISRILRIAEKPNPRELVEGIIFTDQRMPEQLVIPRYADPTRAEHVLH